MSFFDRLRELSEYGRKNRPEAKQEQLDLEKGDFFAMLIAALGAFLPVLLVLGLITMAVMWLFRAI